MFLINEMWKLYLWVICNSIFQWLRWTLMLTIGMFNRQQMIHQNNIKVHQTNYLMVNNNSTTIDILNKNKMMKITQSDLLYIFQNFSNEDLRRYRKNSINYSISNEYGVKNGSKYSFTSQFSQYEMLLEANNKENIFKLQNHLFQMLSTLPAQSMMKNINNHYMNFIRSIPRNISCTMEFVDPTRLSKNANIYIPGIDEPFNKNHNDYKASTPTMTTITLRDVERPEHFRKSVSWFVDFSESNKMSPVYIDDLKYCFKVNAESDDEDSFDLNVPNVDINIPYDNFSEPNYEQANDDSDSTEDELNYWIHQIDESSDSEDDDNNSYDINNNNNDDEDSFEIVFDDPDVEETIATESGSPRPSINVDRMIDNTMEQFQDQFNEARCTHLILPYNETEVKHTATKVHFADDDKLEEVHPMVQWSFAYHQARRGPWEEHARDRERFHTRIRMVESLLIEILDQTHRDKIYNERFF